MMTWRRPFPRDGATMHTANRPEEHIPHSVDVIRPRAQSGMAPFGLAAARACLCAWVGAALLFVAVAIREVTFPEFPSPTRDQLALLRFPVYYLFGFSLLSTAVAGLAVHAISGAAPRSIRWPTLLALVAILTMLADYWLVYQPLVNAITPPGTVRPPTFGTLHRWSEILNSVQLLCCIAAAGLALRSASGGEH